VSLKALQVPIILLAALFLSLGLGALLPEMIYLTLARVAVLAVAGMMGLGFFILPVVMVLDRKPRAVQTTRLLLGAAAVLWLFWVVLALRLVNGPLLINNATVLVTGLLGGIFLGWLHWAEQKVLGL
jgi:hypothetical protein